MRKRSITTWKKVLDKLVTQIVRLRDKKCVCCASTQGLQTGHYFSRTANMTRWDLRNCNAQCSGCNFLHEANSEPYRRYMVKKYGEDVLKELERMWFKPWRLTEQDCRNLEKHLMKELQKWIK